MIGAYLAIQSMYEAKKSRGPDMYRARLLLQYFFERNPGMESALGQTGIGLPK